MSKSKFTINKQVVRDLQCFTIKEFLGSRLGRLRYFGLPSDEMKDVIDWQSDFLKFTAVERGDPPENWDKQHRLMLTAFLSGIFNKTELVRGDIDEIILKGEDGNGKVVDFPFDVLSLDYSGGLLYRDSGGIQYRLQAIRKLIERQASHKVDYLLFVSSNLDYSKDSEIKTTLENILTELLRASTNGQEVIQAYLDHPNDEVRLKLYVPYIVNQWSSGYNYNCVTEKVIFYLGNRGTHMMNFRFYLKHDPRTTAPRFPRESLFHIINAPMIEIKNGKSKEVTLDLPKLRRSG